MALGYVARFAVTAEKLRRYLERKLRERGWEGDGEPPVEALVTRFISAGYIDDASYARVRSGSLIRRGFGARRIEEDLGQAGITAELRAEFRPDEAALRQSAVLYARKRRLGAFGVEPPDRILREKQIAMLLRAGHRLDHARAVVLASDAGEAERWAAEAEGDVV